MESTPPFKIPERILSLVPPENYTRLLEAQNRAVSSASSEISVKSTTSEFLEAKIRAIEDDEAYIIPLTRRVRSNQTTIRVLKRQRRALIEDIDDRLVNLDNRQRANAPPDEGLLERAYRDTILTRVIAASKRQPAQQFNKAKFKSAVKEYYGIDLHPDLSWCHILGMFISSTVARASHLVPKSMSPEELAHLFGDLDVVTTLPQNVSSLHKSIEKLLDLGDIAVVPVEGEMTSPRKFRCIVLNPSILDKTVCSIPVYDSSDGFKTFYGWELDNRELKFLNDNRPRRRYLYFRFIVSYLWSRRKDPSISDHVDARKFWPSGGEYLHRSTLKTLARCVSGCDIPSSLIESQTFEKSNDSTKDEKAGMTLAADITDLGKSKGYDDSDLVSSVTDTLRDLNA
ncbi:hypothetical protein N7478_000125 [Penicillium angulare]|uniref:uncharacterized protein n=1 Tax=Penicillium angulare TaxID=116970 RepID=UPI0025411534|nr:uncharacterized protein N7478_000125 [Penicillium angulare]KAJ5290874.1 hypothetical protein N7478_000125 [Penicillium angulare]